MHISKFVSTRCAVEAVAPQKPIGEKWCRTSDVTRKVRAGRRHGPRVAVPCRHDQTASPDRLRASRYSFFVDVCIVSLSGKSQSCVSVCNVEMQCLLAKWLILSLVLSFGTSLDRSCICADRIARFRFSSCVRPILVYRTPHPVHRTVSPSRRYASVQATAYAHVSSRHICYHGTLPVHTVPMHSYKI